MPSLVTYSLITCFLLPPQQVPIRADRLVYRSRTDVPVTLAFAGSWLVLQIERGHLAPATCRWCDANPDGSDNLNGFDAWGRRTLKWDDTKSASTWSQVAGYAVAPAIAYGLDYAAARHDGRPHDALVDALLITESMSFASTVGQVVKYTAGRERPFVHVLPPDEKANTAHPSDNNTSFPSGHAILTFSLVTSSAEIASLRGYSYAPWIWRVGLPAATLTAYLRVAADKHYLTDVLAGAGIGSTLGFGLPYFAHRRKHDARIPVVRVVPTAGGQMVAAQWVW